MPLNKPYYGCPFSEAFLRFWQKYTVFRGRASRSEFWWWTLAAVIINALLSLLGDVTDGRLDFLTSLWNLAIVVPAWRSPSAACTIRTSPAGGSPSSAA